MVFEQIVQRIRIALSVARRAFVVQTDGLSELIAYPEQLRLFLSLSGVPPRLGESRDTKTRDGN